jgi:ribosomal protein L11
MMICCPMTGQIKGYPFEVIVSQPPASAVLSDQVKILDWKVRGAKKKGAVTASVIAEVKAKIAALLTLLSIRQVISSIYTLFRRKTIKIIELDQGFYV